MPPPPRVFLLSPARCGSERARLLVSDRARSELASQLRSPAGAPLGEVFAFLSALYFRGKLTYARTFARPPQRATPATGKGVLVITPGAGLWPVETPIDVTIMQTFATVDIAADNARYSQPLVETAQALKQQIGPKGEVVLLGSIASTKYVEILGEIFGQRLLFPASFVGRGDMSRGGLLLRHAKSGEELAYEPVLGATRHGPRPPRLEPLRRSNSLGVQTGKKR